DGGRNAAHPRIVRRSLHGAYRGEGEREKRRRSDELPFHGCFPCRKLHAGQFAWTAYGDKGGKLQYIVPRLGIVSLQWTAWPPSRYSPKSSRRAASPRRPIGWASRPRPPRGTSPSSKHMCRRGFSTAPRGA